MSQPKRGGRSSEVDEWARQYEEYTKNPPADGTILRAYGDDLARIDVEMVSGKAPFLYGRAYVPSIVGMPLGWYLQSVDAEKAFGWKCILLPKAREECIRRLGATKGVVSVKALRVIRKSQSGSSLLCEVAEFDNVRPSTTHEPAPMPATDGLPVAQS